MSFKDLIKWIRIQKKAPKQYDIERFKREKLIITFDNIEECEDFIKCCIAAGMSHDGYSAAFYYDKHVFPSYHNGNTLDYANIYSFTKMLEMAHGYKFAKCSDLLIEMNNITFPSKKDLMDFLGE